MKSKLFAHASVGFLCALFFLFSANALPTPAQRREHADRDDDGIVDRKEKHMEKKFEQKQTSKVNTWWERRADTNNDGLIDSTEAAAWKTLEKEQIDVNGDGVIDSKEKRSSWKYARSKVDTAVEKKYDFDSDGWLAPSETREMLKDKYTLIQTDGTAKVDTQIENQYDVNNDGIIDRSEAEALRNDVIL